MQQGGTIVWVIDADASAFLAQLQKASTQAKTFGNSLQQSVASKVASATKSAANNLTSLADSMAGLTKAGVVLAASGGISIGKFVQTASQLETTSKQVQVLTGSVEGAQKVFGELYNYVLGKPITFPDASKAAKTLLGYGRTVDQVIPDMKTLSTLSIVNGADLQALALVFGQVTSRGALFGQDALQLINNNIPLTTILAKKFGITMQEASEKVNGGKVSAEEFTAAMADYAKSLDISSMSDTFQNRMISLGGSIRSLGLALLGIKIDPVKGFVVEAGGLFDTLSSGLEELISFLKTPEMRQGIIQIGQNLAESAKNAMPFIKDVLMWMVQHFDLVVGLVKAFTISLVALRVAAFALNTVSTVAGTIDLLSKAFAGGKVAAEGFKLAMAGVGAAGAQGNGFALLGVGIGNFVKIIGGVPGIIRTALMAIPAIISAAGSAIMSAFYAIPVVGWIALIVTAVIALFLLLYNKVKPFRDFVNGVFSSIMNAAKVVGDWFANTLGPIFAGVWDGMMNGAKAVGGFFVGVWNGLVAVVKPVVQVFATIAQVVGGILVTGFKVLVAVISTIISVLQPLWDILSLIGAVFVGIAQIIWTVVSSAFQILWTIVSTLVQIIGVILYGTLLKVGEGIAWLFNNAVAIVTVAGAVLGTIFTAIANVFVTIWNGIVAFFTPIVQFIAGIITTYFNIMFTIISTIWNAVAGVFTTVWNAIVEFLTPVINGIAAVISTVFNAVAGTVNYVFNLIKTYIINPISTVVNYVGNTIGQIATFIGNAVTNAYNTVAGWVSKFTQAGKNIIDGIVNGIKNGAGAVVDFIKNVCSNALNAVKSFFGIKSPSKVMAQMGNYLMEGFGKGIEQEGDVAVKAAQTAADGVLGVFDGLQSNVGVDSNFGISGGLSTNVGQLAPVSIDTSNNGNVASAAPSAVIYQTNEVHTDLDMDQVNRNLTWELGKL